MCLRSSVLFVVVLLAIGVEAQNIIYSYSFENGVDGWETVPISNDGFWAWSQNGKADQGTYWDNRPAIDDSENGALVYDGDYIVSAGFGDPNSDYSTAIYSPRLDFSEHSEVFIKFNQYYRNYDSETYLEISTDFGNSWNSIPLNEGINRNVETSNKNFEIIDISTYVADEPNVYIRFLFEGKFYYWILDDIEFYNDFPVIETNPRNVGEYLTLHGYPYEVDDLGWPYVPKEAIVNFAPGTPHFIKAQLREEVGAIVKDSCVCNTIETWLFLDSLLHGPIGLSSTGPTAGTDDHISTSTTASEIDDIDFNKYVKGELTEGPFNQPPAIGDIINAHQPPKGNEMLKIAIVDTGIDILHTKLDNHLYLSYDEPNNEMDDDKNCYPDNAVGWNFIDDNNNASDDHGHGTHVAGIVAKYCSAFSDKNLIQFIPYKTHDSKGLANLFDISCAMYQSIRDKVSVINCSWGFYGHPSPVLRTAIEEAHKQNITVVAATGNDSLYLDDLQQYPACYQLPNLISVGSYNFDERKELIVNSPFSNFGAQYVDVLAPGVNILSTIPYDDFDNKSGTSMAAPVVAGIAATKYLMGFTDPVDVKDEILYDAQDHDHLTFEVLSGNVLIDETYTGLEPDPDGGYEGRSSFGNISIDSDLELMGNQGELEVVVENYNSYLELMFHVEVDHVSVFVLNTQGQVFSRKNLHAITEGAMEQVDINDLPSGLYFLKVNEKVFQFIVF
ncbi:MAG: S8 family serine peptidase [Bacteroidota bacterium]